MNCCESIESYLDDITFLRVHLSESVSDPVIFEFDLKAVDS